MHRKKEVTYDQKHQPQLFNFETTDQTTFKCW